jgi:hypothetical protein
MIQCIICFNNLKNENWNEHIESEIENLNYINKPTTKHRIRPCLICGYEQAKVSILEHTMTHIKNYDKYNLTENNYKFLVDKLNLKMYKCKSCEY